MASILCRLGENFPATHTHTSVPEVADCTKKWKSWGKSAGAASVAALKERPKPVALPAIDPTDVPFSKYALVDSSGVTRFYTVKKSKNPKSTYRYVYQLFGSPGDWRRSTSFTGPQSIFTLASILNDSYNDVEGEHATGKTLTGFEAGQVRYARKFRRCGRCDAPLSDPLSRARGIGPDCWKKIYGA